MTNETRGSDKLSTICDATRQLSPEEIEQVAGGIALNGSTFEYRPFPRGVLPDVLSSDRLFNLQSLAQDLNQRTMR